MGLIDRDWFKEESRKREGMPPLPPQKPTRKKPPASAEDLAKARNVPPADVVAAARKQLAKRANRQKSFAFGLLFALAVIATAAAFVYW